VRLARPGIGALLAVRDPTRGKIGKLSDLREALCDVGKRDIAEVVAVGIVGIVGVELVVEETPIAVGVVVHDREDRLTREKLPGGEDPPFVRLVDRRTALENCLKRDVWTRSGGWTTTRQQLASTTRTPLNITAGVMKAARLHRTVMTRGSRRSAPILRLRSIRHRRKQAIDRIDRNFAARLDFKHVLPARLADRAHTLTLGNHARLVRGTLPHTRARELPIARNTSSA
jgi:hypothetical protein